MSRVSGSACQLGWHLIVSRVISIVLGRIRMNSPSSSSYGAFPSTLTNLSHSVCPFSSNRLSGIQARRYVGFVASCAYERNSKYMGRFAQLRAGMTHPFDDCHKPRNVISRIRRGVDIHLGLCVQ